MRVERCVTHCPATQAERGAYTSIVLRSRASNKRERRCADPGSRRNRPGATLDPPAVPALRRLAVARRLRPGTQVEGDVGALAKVVALRRVHKRSATLPPRGVAMGPVRDCPPSQSRPSPPICAKLSPSTTKQKERTKSRALGWPRNVRQVSGGDATGPAGGNPAPGVGDVPVRGGLRRRLRRNDRTPDRK